MLVEEKYDIIPELLEKVDIFKLKTVKEKLFMLMFLHYGYEKEVKLMDLTRQLFREYEDLTEEQKDGKKGHVYIIAKTLEKKGVLKILKEPLRYQLKRNRATRVYAKYLLSRRFGIEVEEEMLM